MTVTHSRSSYHYVILVDDIPHIFVTAYTHTEHHTLGPRFKLRKLHGTLWIVKNLGSVCVLSFLRRYTESVSHFCLQFVLSVINPSFILGPILVNADDVSDVNTSTGVLVFY